jgi:hypothetical protein
VLLGFKLEPQKLKEILFDLLGKLHRRACWSLGRQRSQLLILNRKQPTAKIFD